MTNKLITILIAFISPVIHQTLQGSEVLVVLSGDNPPFRQAASEIVEYLETNKHNVKQILLSEYANNKSKESPDLYIAIGSNAAIAGKNNASESCKMIYCMVSKPEKLKLENQDNTWGISMKVPIKNQLDLISQSLPEVKLIGFLYQSSVPNSQDYLNSIKNNLPEKMELKPIDIDNKKYNNISDAIEDMFTQDIEAVWTYPNSKIYNKASVQQILLTSIRKKIPVYGYSSGFVKAGALIGASIDVKKHGLQTAELAHEICNNKYPAAKTIRPKYNIIINQIVAERLSIKIEEEVVKMADVIYE